MKTKPILILMFVLILLVPGVLGQPPFQDSSIADNQLSIIVPSIEYFLVDSDVTFYAHVFNSSGYILGNDTTDCYMDAYDNLGSHLIDVKMSFNDTETEFYVDANSSINSNVGLLGFIIQCNNTLEAGYYSGSVDVNTKSTLNGFYSENILAVILCMIATIFFFGVIGYFSLKYSGINEDKTTFWFSIFCVGIAIAEFIFMIGILFVNELGWNLSSLLEIHFYIMLILSFGVGFGGLVLITIRIFRWKGEDQKDQKW